MNSRCAVGVSSDIVNKNVIPSAFNVSARKVGLKAGIQATKEQPSALSIPCTLRDKKTSTHKHTTGQYTVCTLQLRQLPTHSQLLSHICCHILSMQLLTAHQKNCFCFNLHQPITKKSFSMERNCKNEKVTSHARLLNVKQIHVIFLTKLLLLPTSNCTLWTQIQICCFPTIRLPFTSMQTALSVPVIYQ